MTEGLAASDVERVLRRAEAASGIDFSLYRLSTMQRRVELRMAMCETIDVSEYLARLDADPREMPALLDALLIKTTWMYREPRTWDLLRRHALSELFADRAMLGAKMIRAWVPACSTGEEAHTLAMCLHEARNANEDLEFQIFASDIAEGPLAVAREGVYPLASCTAVPDDLRARYLEPFSRGGSRFVRVAEDLRARITFEVHDALRSGRLAPVDAGVASFDLVSCKNLLVYLRPAAQEELFRRLLKTCSPGTVVVLGDSEALRAVTTHGELVPIQGKIPVFRHS